VFIQIEPLLSFVGGLILPGPIPGLCALAVIIRGCAINSDAMIVSVSSCSCLSGFHLNVPLVCVYIMTLKAERKAEGIRG
jgi:hypothetical protein